MIKITKQQIQFIDNYLQNSEFIFVDVRAEMTDHVASAVEAKMQQQNLDFYDAFKSYMIENKAALLKLNNKIFRHYWTASVNFTKTLYKPYNLFFALFLILTFQFVFPFLDEVKALEIINKGLFFSIIALAISQTIYSSFFTRKRYLYLEKTFFIFLIIYYFNLFSNGSGYMDFHGNNFTIGITVFLLFAFFAHYIKTVSEFKMKYS